MGANGSKSVSTPKFADDFYGKSHKRLAAPLLRQFASGVKYNCIRLYSGMGDFIDCWDVVKIIIRGDHCTGKSTLLKMLHNISIAAATSQSQSSSFWFIARGEPNPPASTKAIEAYIPTRQIQVTNLKWKYKETDDVIKVEVWDVVDQGLTMDYSVSPLSGNSAKTTIASTNPVTKASILDAEAIDVYRHCNGVIMAFDVTKARTIEYVSRHLSKVPRDLPVLILGNFADKLFNEDDIDFQKRRFESIRGTDANSSCAPLHFMIGSLTQPNCPSNPSAGLIAAVMKFFELPFLQMQRNLLDAKLKINEEQMERARREWSEMIHPELGNSISADPASLLAQPAVARTSRHNLTSLELLSTDTLTKASTQAWGAPSDQSFTHYYQQ